MIDRNSGTHDSVNASLIVVFTAIAKNLEGLKHIASCWMYEGQVYFNA